MILNNIRLRLSYDGTQYSGWQRQKNAPTIQGVLENKLSIITNNKVTVNGAGRTDAGVHALDMVANFLTSSTMGPGEFIRALNSMLPADIRILDAQSMPREFHARYQAIGKTYRYDFFTGRIQLPHERLYRTHVRTDFSLNLVLPCLDLLLGSHDFSAFEATGSRDTTRTGGRGAVRTLTRADCLPAASDYFSFIFSGDGFLRHMVRNIAGTLFLVGAGKINSQEFVSVLQQKDRSLAGPTAPPCGLFLQHVHYPSYMTKAP